MDSGYENKDLMVTVSVFLDVPDNNILSDFFALENN